jgi:predicted transcriptional regulator
MPRRTRTTPTISVYIPEKAQTLQVLDRLRELGVKRDRSVNYLVVEAIIQFLDREEAS